MKTEHISAPEEMSNTERRQWYETKENVSRYLYGTRGGWKKDQDNPVFGDGYGVCFDVSVLFENKTYKMWFSWRTKHGIGYTESKDGKHWGKPSLVLEPVPQSNWESDEVNRPSVVYHDGQYLMWYSGQMYPYQEKGTSALGLAVSEDGVHWIREGKPVLIPAGGWEGHAIMCPYVMYDKTNQYFRMWYSGGSNHEPDAIGYAESLDGITWNRKNNQPIFDTKNSSLWDRYKVLACQVIPYNGWFYMFYIGHFHEERASIGLARSKNGIEKWERYPNNPIIAPDQGAWDDMSVYKPFVLHMDDKWIMWYNGAAFDPNVWAVEKIGLAYHDQSDLWN